MSFREYSVRVGEDVRTPTIQVSHQEILVLGFENVLHDEAKAACRAAAAASNPREGGAKSIAAVLLAVAAVEAVVYSWISQWRERYSLDDQVLRQFRRQRIPEVIKDIFARLEPPAYAPSYDWYNGLCAAAELRNHIAHYYPEARMAGSWPDALKGFVTGKVLIAAGDETMD